MTKLTDNTSTETNQPHWIEWATGALSAILVLVVIIWIGKDALMDRDVSPNLEGRVIEVEARSHGYQVLFEMRNGSSQTASQVTVRGEILDTLKTLETAETVMDYVPGHSRAKGGLVFQNDPRGRSISIRAISFVDP
jgi:uncharacterized protein (TIGR02588 family)